MRIILLAALILTGCGADYSSPINRINPERTTHRTKVDLGEFSSFVDAFLLYAKDYGSDIEINDLIIQFKDIPAKEDKIILGKCFIGPNISPTIHIDPEEWEDLGDTSREILMYHELGHCILRRSHFDDTYSIMNTYLLSPSKFRDDEGGILTELFDQSKYGSFSYLHLTTDHGPTCEVHK